MPFLKLDCGILDSTVWQDADARIVFLTALLMAEPREFREPVAQIAVRSLEATGWSAPAGWFGFISASGAGILRRAGIDPEAGMSALERLGAPDPESRTPDYDGRRLVRVDGGYLVLNYQRYRDRDHSAKERARRYRLRKKQLVTSRHGVTTRNVTQGEVEGEVQVEAVRKEKLSGRESASCQRPSRAHPLPVDFLPDDTAKALAKELGVDMVEALAKFRDHATAAGRIWADWQAAFRKWLRGETAFRSRRRTATEAEVRPSRADRYRHLGDDDTDEEPQPPPFTSTAEEIPGNHAGYNADPGEEIT